MNIEFYKDFFRTTELGIVYYDKQGKIIDANPAAERILGLSTDQMNRVDLNSDFWNFIKEDGTPFHGDEHPAMVAIRTGKHVKDIVMGIGTPELKDYRWIKINAVPEFADKERKPYRVHTTFSDITEDKNAFTDPEYFKGIVENSSDAVCISAPEGKLYYKNKSFVELFGKIEDDLPENLYVDKKEGQRVFKTVMNGSEWSGELKMFGKGKKILDIFLKAYSINNEQGNVKGLVSVYRDITEPNKIRHDLEASEKRFRLMIEHSSDAITLVGADESIIYESPSAPLLSGYSPEERKGKSAYEYIYPDDIEGVKNIYKKIIETPGISVCAQFRVIRKDGAVWWCEAIATNSLNDEDLKAIVVNYRDITDRKEVERALRKSEIHLMNAMKMAKIGHWEYDVINDIFTFNDQFYEVLRTTADQAGGYTMPAARYVKLFVHPDEEDVVARETRKAIETDDPDYVRQVEHKVIFADGKVGYIAVRFSIIKDNTGRTIGTAGTNQDITERKKIEEKLKRQNDEYQELTEEYMTQNEELADTLKQMQRINKKFKKAREKAEESDHLKTAFLANMSHEIRTPMNGIIGFAELLKLPELTNSEKNEYLDVIIRSGERMLNIINDLIDISKIEAGEIEVKKENVNINELLEDLFTFFKPEVNEKGLLFIYTKQITSEESIIHTDKTKLSQIISNLIKNAIKYTNKGHIKIGCTIIKNNIKFFVEDTGIGIKPEYMELIFDRFRQGDVSDVTNCKGVGLGLSITKSYIEILGGKIWLESEPDKGTTFYFTMPYKSGKVNKSKKDRSYHVSTKKSWDDLTVLIADDDDMSYTFLNEILKRLKIKNIHVENGLEAIEAVKENSDIDLILMDIRMPVLGGLEATKHIKKIRPHVPVIAQTAYATLNDEKRAYDAGCCDYISKPINRNLLIEKIKKHLVK